MNRRGFVTTTVTVGIMMVTFAFLAVFYATMQMRNVQIGLSENPIVATLEERTATERLYGIFNNDMYRTEPILFNDGNTVTFEIEEIASVYPERLIYIDMKKESKGEMKHINKLKVLLEHLPNTGSDLTSRHINLTILETVQN